MADVENRVRAAGLSKVRKAGNDYQEEEVAWRSCVYVPKDIELAAQSYGWYLLTGAYVEEMLAWKDFREPPLRLRNTSILMISDPDGNVVAFRDTIKEPFIFVRPEEQMHSFSLEEEPLWSRS
jgi:hypothetical protein